MIVGAGIAFSATFVTAVVFANFVDPAIYGYYKYVIAVVTLLSAFSLSGIPSVMPRSVAQGFEGTYKHLSASYFQYSLVSIFLASCIAGYYFVMGNPLLGWSILIAGLLAPLFRSLDFYSSFLEGKKDFKRVVKVQFFYALVPNLTLVTTLFFTDFVPYIVLSYFASGILTNTLITLYVVKTHKPNDLIDPKAKNFSKHTSVMNMLGILTTQLDKILVFQFIGAAQVAIFAIATALPLQFQVFAKGLRSIVYPKMSTQSFTQMRKEINRRFLFLHIVAAFAYVCYFLAVPIVFELFFPVYKEAVFMSQVLALLIFFYPSMLYQIALYVHVKKRLLYIVKITSSVAKILLLLLLIPLFGLWGVIGAFLSTYFIEAVMYFWIFNITLRHEK